MQTTPYKDKNCPDTMSSPPAQGRAAERLQQVTASPNLICQSADEAVVFLCTEKAVFRLSSQMTLMATHCTTVFNTGCSKAECYIHKDIK